MKARQAVNAPRPSGCIKEEAELHRLQTEIHRLRTQLAVSNAAASDSMPSLLVSPPVRTKSSEQVAFQSKVQVQLDETKKTERFLKQERRRLLRVAETHQTSCDTLSQTNEELRQAATVIASQTALVQTHFDALHNEHDTLQRNHMVFVEQAQLLQREIQLGQAYATSQDEMADIYRDALERMTSLVHDEYGKTKKGKRRHTKLNADLVHDIHTLVMTLGHKVFPQCREIQYK